MKQRWIGERDIHRGRVRHQIDFLDVNDIITVITVTELERRITRHLLSFVDDDVLVKPAARLKGAGGDEARRKGSNAGGGEPHGDRTVDEQMLEA
jgi:hypothetical protein